MKKLAKYIDRSASVITGKKNLEPLYCFKDFPVFMGCTELPQEDDIVADMKWGICKDTGVIQLAKLLPLDILYLNQHNEGYGNTWIEHYLAFCEFLKKYNPKCVLEIGGAHGFIAENFIKISPETSWTIIEPNPTLRGNEKIKVIKGWFDENFSIDKKIDTIVHSHVLEHAYDPAAYLERISKFLKEGDKHIFTFPNMLEQLIRKYTNCLNFEHTVFLTEHFVDYLLQKSRFKIIEKKYYKDHSIFYSTEKIRTLSNAAEPASKYNEYKNLFMSFVNYHKKMINDLNEKIKSASEPVYLFGAHIFATYLFAFGLKQDKIISILDNSPTKQGRRLYGTSFKVESPKILKDKGRVNVILKAGIYNEEIKKDISENINNQANFW